MPKDGREYKFKLNIDNKSLQDITDQLSDALSQGAKEGWNRSTMSDAKDGLGQILKYGKQTAKELHGELGNALDISDFSPKAKMLFDNLDAVLKVTTEITAAMQETGNSLDWMKQGVSLVKGFKDLKDSVDQLPLDKFKTMENSMEMLTTQFQGFINALKVTQPEAFFKRFGDNAEKEVKHIEKVKARLEKASDFSSIKNAIETGKGDAFSVEDFVDFDEKELQEEYDRIKQAMQDSLADILKIEQDYLKKKNKKSLTKTDKEFLYKQTAYQQAMGDLSAAYYSMEAMQKHLNSSTGLAINIDTSEIKNTVQEAVTLIKEAKGDLESAIKGLDLKDIELSVVLPDAKSAEFSGKINQIINEAQEQFNTKPIEVSLDFTNPIKIKKGKKLTKGQEDSAKEVAKNFTELYNKYIKQEEGKQDIALSQIVSSDANSPGVLFDKQSHVSAEAFLKSFLKIVNTVTTSQDMLLEATKKWRDDMDEQLKLKFSWDTADNEQDQKAALTALFHLANQIAEENPIFLKVDSDYFLGQIENALKERTFEVNATLGDVTGNIQGGIPFIPGGGSSGISFSPSTYSAPQPSLPAATIAELNDDSEEIRGNTDAIKQSAQASSKSATASNALERAVQALETSIKNSNERIELINQAIKERETKAQENSEKIQEKQELISSYEARARQKGSEAKDLEANRKAFVESLSSEEQEYINKSRQLYEKLKKHEELGTDGSEIEKELRKLKENYKKIEIELQGKIEAYNRAIEFTRGSIASADASKGQALLDLRELTGEDKIASSKRALQRNVSERNRAQSRQKTIQKVLESENDPITLAADSLSTFWKKSDQAISSAQKNMSDISKETADMQNKLWKLEDELKGTEAGTAKYQELTNAVEELSDKIAKNLNSLSDENKKRFNANVTRYSNAKAQQHYVETNLGLTRDISSEDLSAILKSNPTIAYDLEHIKDKGLGFKDASQSMRDMAYFFNVVKESMGVVAQTSGEWENAEQTQQMFLNLFRTIKFINELNKLLVETNRAPSVEDLQRFKQTYQYIPEMQSAVAAVDEYLGAMGKLSQATNNDELFQKKYQIGQADKYLDEAIEQAIGNLSSDDKSVVRAAFAQNGLKLNNSIELKDLQSVYNSGAFDGVGESKLTTELRALINALETKSLYQQATDKFNNVIKQISSGKYFDGTEKGSKAGRDVSGARQMPDALKRAMRISIDDSKPLAVSIKDPGGNSKVYGIQRRGTAKMDADGSFNTTSRDLYNFLKTSGLEAPIYEYLDLEPIIHNLEAAVQKAKNNQDVELEQKLQAQLDAANQRRNEIYEHLFSSGLVSVTTDRNAFTKTSAQNYGFGDTEYGRNLARKSHLEAELARLDTLEDNEVTRGYKEKTQRDLDAVIEILRQQENKLEAIHALENDITIAKAKLAEAQANLTAIERSAANLSGRASGGEMFRISGKKIRTLMSGTNSVNSLLPYIQTAKQYGTMDVSVIAEIEQLFEEREKVLGDFNKLSKIKKEGPEGTELKNELKSYKEQIAKKFYQAEGWYITELLTSSINDANRNFNDIVRQADTTIADAQSTIGGDQAAITKLENEHEAEKAKINSNVDALINNMVYEPIKAVNDKLEADKQKAKKNKKKYTAPSDSEKDALYVQAINDHMLQQALAPVQKTKEQLQVQREQLLSAKSFHIENQHLQTLRTDFDNEIKALENQYKREKRQEEQYKQGKIKDKPSGDWKSTFDKMLKLREERQKRVRELTEERFGKTDPEIVALDAQIAALEAEATQNYKPVASVQEATTRLEEQRANALQAEIDRHTEAVQEVLQQVSADNAVATDIIAEANRIKQDAETTLNSVVQDSVKALQTGDGKFKTDAAAMAEYARQGQASAKAAVEAAQQIVNNLEENRQALIAEAGASEEVVEAHQRATQAAKNSANAAKQRQAATTSSTQGSTGYYGYPTGGFAINTSGLATEGTLRGIYQLLNGGPPVGGWDDGAQKLAESISKLTANVDESDIASKAFSWKNMLQNASVRKTEGSYLIGADGQIGKTIQGTKASVPHQKVVDALQQYVNEEILGILHNHPSGMSAFDRDDLIVAIQRAYSLGGYKDTKQVKSSGVIGGGKLTAIDFSSMTLETAKQVLHNFEDTLRQATEGNPGFNWDEQGNLSIAQELIDSPENRAVIEKMFNVILQNAFESVGHGGAFQQFNASNIDEYSKQLAAKAQQKVTENIVEQGAQAAIEVAALPSQAKMDAHDAAKQAATQANITVDKDKLSIFKSQLDQRYQKEKTARESKVDNPWKRPKGEADLSKNITRVSKNLFQDYSGLDKKTADKNLAELANGYIGLIRVIESEFYDQLQDDTKLLVNQAIESAKSVLDANGVQIRGQDLVGKAIQESYLKTKNGQELMRGSRQNNPAKVGNIISSVHPAIMRNGEILQPAFVTSHKAKTGEEKALAAEVLGLEKQIEGSKKKQADIDNKAVPKEQASAKAAQAQAKAEEATVQAKKEQAAATPKTNATPQTASGSTTPPSGGSGINVPVGNNNGGIIGILGQLAKDETVGQIISILGSKKDGSSGGGGGASKKKDGDDSGLDAETALQLLQTEAAKYSGATKISNMRAGANSYSLDIYRSKATVDGTKEKARVLEIQKKINELEQQGNTETREYKNLQIELNSLLQSQEKITLSINKNTKAITTKSGFQDLALGANAAEKELQNVAAIMQQLHNNRALSFDDAGNIVSDNSAINHYIQSLQQLRTYRDSLSQEELFSPENQQRLSAMALAVQNYRKQVEGLLKSTAQFNDGEVLGVIGDSSILNDFSQVRQAMIGIVSESSEGEKTFGQLKLVTDTLGNSHYELAYTLRTGQREVQEMTAVLNPLTNEIIEQKGALKPVQTAWDKFLTGMKSKWVSIVQYTASITSIHDIINQFRKGLQYVKEIDAAMTELKKVTDETRKTYEEFEKTASAIAKTTGTTMSSVISSAADWARLGYTIEEAADLAKNTSILMNVSEFDDISKATDTMISALQAYKGEGEDVADLSMEIIDKFNTVGNNYAISTSDLADSLTRSSATLVAAGNTLSESIALTTAANTIIQDPDSVGNALKVVSMRLRGTSAKEITAAGEETDGLISSTSKLAAKVQELTSIDGEGGVKILSDSGAYKSTYQILLEISEVWDKISDVKQAALLEILAGKTRGSVVAALLDSGEILEEVLESSENSAGSSMKELNTYLDSIEGRIQLLTNAVQTLWNNFLNDEVIKWVVDLLTKLVELVDTVGLVPTAMGALGMFGSFGGGLKNKDNSNWINKAASSIADAIFKTKVGDKSSSKTTSKTTTNLLKDIGADRAMATATGEALTNMMQPAVNSMSTGAQQIESAGTNIQSAAQKMDNAAGRIEAAIKGDTFDTDVEADIDAPEIDEQMSLFDGVQEGASEASSEVENLTDILVENNDVSQDLIGASDGLKSGLDDVKTGATGAAVAEGVQKTATQLTTAEMLKQKVVAAGLKIGLGLLQGVGMMLAGMLISKLVNAFAEASRKMKDLKEEAITSADALKENRDTVDDYKEEINDLRATLANYTTSEQDAYDARVRLMEIQDDIISKYGKEAEGINLVTGSIKEQIATIDELDRKNANEYVTTYKTAFDDAKRELNKSVKSRFTLTEGQIDEALLSEFEEFIGDRGFSKTVNDNAGNDQGYEYDNPDSYVFNARDSKIDFEGIYDEIVAWIGKKAEEGYDVEHLRTRISSAMSDLDFDDEDYVQNKEVYDTYVEQKVLSDYTQHYKNIIDAESAYKDAKISGDTDAQSEALTDYKTSLEAAAKAASDNGEQYMADYFNGQLADLENDVKKDDFIKNVNTKDSSSNKMAKQIQEAVASSGLYQTDILEMLRLENAGELDDANYGDAQVEAFRELKKEAEAAGISVEDAADALVQLGYIKVSPEVAELDNVGKSVDMLSAGMTKYQTAMTAMKEITYNNMQVSEEYYTALADYIGDTAELNEAFYTENGEYIVTNTELLQKLIKQKQKEQAADVKVSRAQARLRYYDLYKQMRSLTSGQKKLTGAALDEVNALYQQMSSIEKTIAKYSLLETKLLGVTNAFDDLEAAQAADEEMDYGSQAEAMVNALAEAFNTAELGTEAAQVAFEGLIPDDIIDKTKTLDEQMEQAYSYFTKGKLSKLFTIEFDDEGAIESVEMTKENIEAFTKSLIGSAEDGAVFQGTWDKFTLNPAITSMEQFAEAIGTTEEVAFAYLTSLEKYDIGWLGEDFSTMLDQLMGDDLDYQLYDKMQKIADLEVKIANGTITKPEQRSYGKLIGEMEDLEEEAVTSVTKYGELSAQLDETKQEIVDLNKELEGAEEGSDAYNSIIEKLEKAQKEAAILVNQMGDVEPTEFTLQVAADEAQEQIDEFKASVDDAEINAVIKEVDEKGLEDLGLTKDANGVWSGLANIKGFSSLDAESKAKVIEYLNLINSQHVIDALMGEGITTTEQHLENIVNILEKTYELIVEATVDDSEVVTFRNRLKHPWQKTVDLIANWLEGDDENSSESAEDSASIVNGTAHVRGTAFKTGSWGAPRTETALVGELGPEMVVRGNRWFTVGENGAEFTDIKKGDIIFNHKQTEDLLSKGYVTGRGKAYASGTAYAFTRDSGVMSNAFYSDYEKLKKENIVIKNLNMTPGVTYLQAQSSLGTTAEEVKSTVTTLIDTWDDAYNKLSEDYSNNGGTGSSGSSEDTAEELIDFIEIKLEEIEQIISKTAARLELLKDDTSQTGQKDDIYDQLVNAEKDKAKTYLAAAEKYNSKAVELLQEVPEKYRDMAENGAIAIEDFVGEDEAEIAEAINTYREYATKADEAETGYYESLQQQSAYRLEQINDIADDYDNLIGIIDTESELLQSEMDYVEESGGRLSEAYYNRLTELTEQRQDEREQEKKDLEKMLKDAVASGEIEYGSDEWYEARDLIAEMDAEIVQCKIDMESYQNAINDLKWDNLDKLISRFEALDSELSHIYDRLTDDDKVVDDFGNWTDDGIAAMGVLAQQMEIAQYQAEQYGDAIDDLKKDYKKGKYSQDEYNEKLAELTEQQWESIEAYEDAKDSLVDLNKTRIEAVKEGMQEEIDAYKELIDKQKESLDAEKDLYDFEKNIAEQQKDISTLERKIAALSTDTSASAAAQRKQLEAELLEAKAKLEDTYYDRSVEQQKEALDTEYENYEESMNKEMEALDEYLTNTEQVVIDSMNTVKSNASVVLEQIKEISKQYGIDITSSITNPWKDGSNAISGYKNSFKNLSDSFSEELDKIIEQEKNLQKQAEKTAKSVAKTVSKKVSSYSDEDEYDEPENTHSDIALDTNIFNNNSNNNSNSSQTQQVETKTIEVGGKIDATGAKIYGFAGDTTGEKQYYSNDPIYTVLKEENGYLLVRHHKLSSGASGWFKKSDVKAYAKGTLGTKDDEWAWIDEIGEELVLHAGQDGKLSYLTKGSSVVPADVTSKLMDLVLDPTQTLENSRPVISAPYIVNNEINIDASIGEVIHIDNVSNDTLPNFEKVVEKQMDKYVKNLNAQIRKYTR